MKLFLMMLTSVFLLGGVASADVDQIKIYKKVFPSAKPKCIDCHVSDKPKKEQGQHDLNDYGKKAVEAATEPTEETYKTIGPVENSKSK